MREIDNERSETQANVDSLYRDWARPFLSNHLDGRVEEWGSGEKVATDASLSLGGGPIEQSRKTIAKVLQEHGSLSSPRPRHRVIIHHLHLVRDP